MMRDDKVRIELSEFIVIKLIGVVQDDNLRNSESADDVFPYKTSSISLCDFGERFRFYPFGKVINGDDQEFSL